MRPVRFLLGLNLILMCFAACYYYRLEQQLDLESRDWLQRVSHIITAQERKVFLSLPEAERESFREEFWRKRDPDPMTEENELKVEYFLRLEKANELFFGEGREGYLTDRGRILVLYGLPLERTGSPPDEAGRTSEIWYYGNFPVIFVDEFSTGRFTLVTFDLSPLRDLNIKYMHEIGRSPDQAESFSPETGGGLSFDWDVRIGLTAGSNRVEGEVEISVPLLHLWFSSEEGRMKTSLDLRLEIRNPADELIWEHEEAFPLDLAEAALEEDRRLRHRMTVALLIEGAGPRLRQGTNRLLAVLTNRTGGATARRVKTFKLD
jgi:GWxTD domain-containing protein